MLTVLLWIITTLNMIWGGFDPRWFWTAVVLTVVSLVVDLIIFASASSGSTGEDY